MHFALCYYSFKIEFRKFGNSEKMKCQFDQVQVIFSRLIKLTVWSHVKMSVPNLKLSVVCCHQCCCRHCWRWYLNLKVELLPSSTHVGNMSTGKDPLDHQSCALTTVLARNLLESSKVSNFLFHAPLHMLDFVLSLESIEHDFIKALMIHTDNQIVT